MNPIRRNVATIALVASLGALAGCASSGFGPASADQQQLVNDLVVERTINRAFNDDPRLAGTNIIVGCTDGVVTLGGSVDNTGQISIAEQVARDISGVQEIRNAITS